MEEDKQTELSLNYHRSPRPGKLSVEPSKPCDTQLDLSLAYSPGVAAPCLAIQADIERVFEFTGRGNTVAVVSDGTAVLGLGNIGAEAALPVMEGKAVLFKRFAGIDAVPLCLSGVQDARGASAPKKLIDTVKRLEPNFGGINLEDIAAPACFEIEERLKAEMRIPVFHDDQHGTAIICVAAILNSLELTGRRIEEVRIAINGAGAAGLSCARMCQAAGADPQNILLCDSRGVIHRGREEGMTSYKRRFARTTDARCLEDAMKGSDVFLGLSCGNCVTREMIRSMAPDPIVFAMANPVPEIFPAEAVAAGAAVVGTGRSDFSNQVNNVLGFPGIFRGALDVRATGIDEAMKMAAALGLMELVREEIPADVKAYLSEVYPADRDEGIFEGTVPLKRSYVIPKPFDPRVVPRVAARVAEAAMSGGKARVKVKDLSGYEDRLRAVLTPRKVDESGKNR